MNDFLSGVWRDSARSKGAHAELLCFASPLLHERCVRWACLVTTLFLAGIYFGKDKKTTTRKDGRLLTRRRSEIPNFHDAATM